MLLSHTNFLLAVLQSQLKSYVFDIHLCAGLHEISYTLAWNLKYINL